MEMFCECGSMGRANRASMSFFLRSSFFLFLLIYCRSLLSLFHFFFHFHRVRVLCPIHLISTQNAAVYRVLEGTYEL